MRKQQTLCHTDELVSPAYEISIFSISYGRVTKSSVCCSMRWKMGCPFCATVVMKCCPESLLMILDLLLGIYIYITRSYIQSTCETGERVKRLFVDFTVKDISNFFKWTCACLYNLNSIHIQQISLQCSYEGDNYSKDNQCCDHYKNHGR